MFMYNKHNFKGNTKIEQHCIKHYMNEINKYKDVFMLLFPPPIDNYLKNWSREKRYRDVSLIKKNMKTNSDKPLEKCLI